MEGKKNWGTEKGARKGARLTFVYIIHTVHYSDYWFFAAIQIRILLFVAIQRYKQYASR